MKYKEFKKMVDGNNNIQLLKEENIGKYPYDIKITEILLNEIYDTVKQNKEEFIKRLIELNEIHQDEEGFDICSFYDLMNTINHHNKNRGNHKIVEYYYVGFNKDTDEYAGCSGCGSPDIQLADKFDTEKDIRKTCEFYPDRGLIWDDYAECYDNDPEYFQEPCDVKLVKRTYEIIDSFSLMDERNYVANDGRFIKINENV